MEAALGEPGLCARDDAEADHRISLALDALEARHDFVLLLADDAPGAWTRRCVRNSDEMLLLADATAEPRLHPIETACLAGRSTGSEAAEILVLLHPPETPMPRGTQQWLARRPLSGHVHLRRGHGARHGAAGTAAQPQRGRTRARRWRRARLRAPRRLARARRARRRDRPGRAAPASAR